MLLCKVKNFNWALGTSNRVSWDARHLVQAGPIRVSNEINIRAECGVKTKIPWEFFA